MPKYDDIHLDLDEINDTELVALCKWVGIDNASRAWPREILMRSLLHMVRPDVPQVLEKRRVPLSKWLQRYWGVIQMQVQKRVCPECTLCTELQVMTCYEKNSKYLRG